MDTCSHTPVVNCVRIFILSALFFFNSKSLLAQVSYPDSCLKLEFYYQLKTGRLDTIKSIKLIKGTNNFESIYWNDSLLNLVVMFRNLCNQKIAIPSEVAFGTDFWIEGVKINSDQVDTLEQVLAVDYFHGTGVRDEIVEPHKNRLLPYPFPLGLKIKAKGIYKFRLQFDNSHNYIPFNEWKTYLSNWLYLKLL